ncbi:MAG: hypothetical protein ACM3NQ_16530 [Bacteroidales bacterium]
MRRTLAALLVGFLTCASPSRAQAPASMLVGADRDGLPLVLARYLDDRLLASGLQQLGIAAHVPMGIEFAPAPTGDRMRPSVAALQQHRQVTGMTFGEALEWMLQANPKYEWFEEGGVVHVRPKGARAEPDNFLNTVVPTFTLTDATLRQILDAYRGAFTVKPLATPTSIGSGARLLRGDDRTTLAARTSRRWIRPAAA